MNGMTCRQFDEVVHAFVRMELLDMSVREAVIEHAAHCDNCALRIGEAGALAEVTEAAAVSLANSFRRSGIIAGDGTRPCGAVWNGLPREPLRRCWPWCYGHLRLVRSLSHPQFQGRMTHPPTRNSL
jgi:hypothetical protein